MRTLPLALFVSLAACGPTINVNITTGGEGPESEESTSEGSSGLGATDTGAGSTSSGDAGSTSTGSTGWGSSSEGSSSSSSRGESTTGDGCEVVSINPLEPEYACFCDGEPADPIACGCVWSGQCFCDGEVYPDEVCLQPTCTPDESGICYCDGEPSDQSMCSWRDPTNAACGCVVDIDQVCYCDTGEYPMALCLPC